MAITISYGGSSVTIPDRLVKLPFGFTETNTRRGRTAEIASIEGFILRADADLISALFKSWRDVKIVEEDAQKKGVIGAVVTVTGSGPGFNWSNRACWFDKAPSFTDAGIFVRVAFDLVDATQALQILLEERDDSDEDGLELGTFTLGSAVINLLSYPETYDELPALSRNPSGLHIITGPLTLEEAMEIEGWVTEIHKNNLESWLISTTNVTPAANTWYPIDYQKPIAKPRFGAITYDVKLKVVKIQA